MLSKSRIEEVELDGAMSCLGHTIGIVDPGIQVSVGEEVPAEVGHEGRESKARRARILGIRISIRAVQI